MTNDELCAAVTELLALMNEHGTRAEQVRQFILARKDESFRDVALVVIFLRERLTEDPKLLD